MIVIQLSTNVLRRIIRKRIKFHQFQNCNRIKLGSNAHISWINHNHRLLIMAIATNDTCDVVKRMNRKPQSTATP